MEGIPLFSISPNPATMYLTPALKAAVARFKRAIARKQGLCLILGGVGLGKSTLLRHVAGNYELDEEHYSVSYLHDSRKLKSSFDFLKVVSEDFEIKPRRSQIAQMGAIEEYLIKNYELNKTTIVCIDEAQRLPLETLELIRSLLNLETDTHKLIQVIAAGQLELRERLLKPQYEAFRSRIVAPLVMEPLKAAETAKMIQARLESWQVDNPFSPEAITEIHRLSNGVPREILLLCQGACDQAAGPEETPTRSVTADDVLRAYQDLQLTDQVQPEAEAVLA